MEIDTPWSTFPYFWCFEDKWSKPNSIFFHQSSDRCRCVHEKSIYESTAHLKRNHPTTKCAEDWYFHEGDVPYTGCSHSFWSHHTPTGARKRWTNFYCRCCAILPWYMSPHLEMETHASQYHRFQCSTSRQQSPAPRLVAALLTRRALRLHRTKRRLMWGIYLVASLQANRMCHWVQFQLRIWLGQLRQAI